MLLYTMLYIVLAYLMLFAALTNSVCLNNASFFFLFKYFLCQGYELSGEIALKITIIIILLLYILIIHLSFFKLLGDILRVISIYFFNHLIKYTGFACDFIS